MYDTVLHSGLGHVPFLMLVTSLEGRVLRANRALRVLVGEPDRLPGSRWDPADVDYVVAALGDSPLLGTLASFQGPVAHRSGLTRSDGSAVEVQWYSHPVDGPDGTVMHVESIGLVITARPSPIPAYTGKHECSCARLAHQLRVLDEVSDHISIMDHRGFIQYVNPAFEAVSGRSSEWAVGRHMSEIWTEPVDPSVQAQMDAAVSAGTAFRGEWVNRNGRGELFFDDLTLSPVRGPSGQITHVIAVGRDTTYLHLSDPLTGLQSRHLLLERIAAAIEDLQRDPWNAQFGLLFVDLDHFKAVNDAYGKDVGDQVILEVSRRIQHTIALTGAAGRVSHVNRDEFAVLLEHLADPGDALPIAARILARIREPLTAGIVEIVLSASIGIAPSSGASTAGPEEVLRDAETAMAHAKRAGGNAVELFTPAWHSHVVERMRLGTELRRALDQRELWLAYQPIVSLVTGEVTGAEALVRWEHPVRGLVPPNDFIGAAEENGLIVQLGDYVLRETCRQLRTWTDLDFGPLAVNVSARQLRYPEFLMRVAQVLQEFELPGHVLKLEVTESTAAHDPDAVTALLQGLKAMGVQILMDDFGTGYSSLNYLTRFPLDKLKIDRSFVQHVPGSVHDASVATTIVAMAHSLGFGVVAEGVETREQLQFLCRLGCEEMQGYLFSPPLGAEAFEALVRSGRRLELPEVGKRVSLELPVPGDAHVSGVHAAAGRASHSRASPNRRRSGSSSRR